MEHLILYHGLPTIITRDTNIIVTLLLTDGFTLNFEVRYLIVSLIPKCCSLPRDQSRDVTLRLGVFIILQCTSVRVRTHLHSGYYYYDYVIIGVLTPLRLN